MGTYEKLVPGEFLMPGKMAMFANSFAAWENNYQLIQQSVKINAYVYEYQNEEIANV